MMKKLFLLIGLVVFLMPMVAMSAENLNYKFCQYHLNDLTYYGTFNKQCDDGDNQVTAEEFFENNIL